MIKYVITCQLAKMVDGKPVLDNEQPVYEKNYFCQFVNHPNVKNVQLIEWDTDIKFAKIFYSTYDAKRVVKQIETGEPLTIEKL